jgi:hypothetical protein
VALVAARAESTGAGRRGKSAAKAAPAGGRKAAAKTQPASRATGAKTASVKKTRAPKD